MSDDDIHKMMNRAHYAEIREARLRIAYGDLKAENERLAAALRTRRKGREVSEVKRWTAM